MIDDDDEEFRYATALKAAGCVVHACKDFGSWGGRWWAFVTYEGKTGWITDYFGSCSGCDNLIGSIGYGIEPGTPEYDARMKAVGSEYLDQIMSQDEAETKAGEDTAWDIEAETMLAFVKAHRFDGTGKHTVESA